MSENIQNQFTVNKFSDEQSKILDILGIEKPTYSPQVMTLTHEPFDIRFDIPDNFWSAPSIIDVSKIDDEIEVVYIQYCYFRGDHTIESAIRRVYKIIYSYVDSHWIESPKLYGRIIRDNTSSIDKYDFSGSKNFRSGSVVYSNKNKAKMVVKYINDGVVVCNWFDHNNNLHEETFNVHDLYFVSK